MFLLGPTHNGARAPAMRGPIVHRYVANKKSQRAGSLRPSTKRQDRHNTTRDVADPRGLFEGCALDLQCLATEHRDGASLDIHWLCDMIHRAAGDIVSIAGWRGAYGE